MGVAFRRYIGRCRALSLIFTGFLAAIVDQGLNDCRGLLVDQVYSAEDGLYNEDRLPCVVLTESGVDLQLCGPLRE
jgi:hypothetical protein